jgi:hypothetical protein
VSTCPVHCYLVDWATFTQRAVANRTEDGIDWFWFAAEDGEPWLVRFTDLASGWDNSGHRWVEEGLTYDDFAEALSPHLRARLDRFFHTLLPSSVEGQRVVELPVGGPGCEFHAALSPATVAELRSFAVGLDFGALWPAFRDVLGEDDDPPPDAAEQLTAGFDEWRRYVAQWVAAVGAAADQGRGLVVA